MDVLKSFQQFEIPNYQDFDYIIGLDEAGRGALAGPVSVSMVSFDKNFFLNTYQDHFWIHSIKDSKLLVEKQREDLFVNIKKNAIIYKNLLISSLIIDKIGINAAIEKAISIFIKYFIIYLNNGEKIKFFIDGNYQFEFQILKEELQRYKIRNIEVQKNKKNLNIYIKKDSKNCLISIENIVKGDNLVFSIACSSIISKVTRDRYMKFLSKIYPEYSFEKHKGYGTKLHLQRIQNFGYSKIHRKSYNITKQMKLSF